jgi:hypothetical protein
VSGKRRFPALCPQPCTRKTPITHAARLLLCPPPPPPSNTDLWLQNHGSEALLRGAASRCATTRRCSGCGRGLLSNYSVCGLKKADGNEAGNTRLQDLKLELLPLLLRRAIHHGTKQRGDAGRNLMIPVTCGEQWRAAPMLTLLLCWCAAAHSASCATAPACSNLPTPPLPPSQIPWGQGAKVGGQRHAQPLGPPGPQWPDERQND